MAIELKEVGTVGNLAKAFGNMRIGNRFSLALLSMVVLVVIVVIVVVGSINALKESQKNLMDKSMTTALQFMRLQRNTARMRADLFFMLMTDSPTVQDNSIADIQDAKKDTLTILPTVKTAFANDPKMKEKVEELVSTTAEFIKEQDDELIPAIKRHEIDNAKSLIFGIQGSNLDRIIQLAHELGKQTRESAEADMSTAKATADASTSVCVVLGLVAVLFSLAAWWSLVHSLNAATAQLSAAAGELGNGVEQILSSVMESSAGTAQTASAVSETTTTVEELKQTSQMSSERANSVFESAQRVQEISATGRNATEQTVEGMKRIRKQMDQIAESMGHLSEKARNIVEIIATVDDLAKQSNLLAVNAAIEAAKAGDHGKGFGVVAQQVKSMADQSKQATAQVRAILDEIQNAATSAAKATEMGSQSVDAAVRQSTQAGDSILLLASSVSESAAAAAQIASASRQQVTGVDQVMTAMFGIKEAATQNVSAITRVEDAANTLSALGAKLKELVDTY
jgi:methyl-accepting chemotaxis protein